MVATLMVAGTTLATAGPAYEDSSQARRIGLVAGSVATSVAYTPAKVGLALGSTVTSGLVLAFSLGRSHENAGQIINSAYRGDWFVHPDVITGHRSMRMVGQ
jgi:hypothetical protein